MKEIGYKGQKVIFKIAAGSSFLFQCAQMIQNDLKNIGINLEIEASELNTLLSGLKQGNFQMMMAQWVGGNQDPIFLRDLFHSKETPDDKQGGRNRSRYANLEFDNVIKKAANSTNQTEAKMFYELAQTVVAKDLPYITIWYPANVVIANKRIGNIEIDPSGDWSFIKKLILK